VPDPRRRPVLRGRLLAAAGVLAAASLAVVSLAGCSGDAASGGGDTRFIAGDGAITVVPVSKRGDAVDLKGDTLDGTPLSVAGLRGKPVVLNVWYSTCGPCRAEAPALNEAYRKLQPSGVAFVGLNSIDSDPDAAKAFERTFATPYPTLFDDSGSLLLGLRGAVPPKAVPTTLVLDAQGRIAARVTGALPSATTLVDLVHDADAPA
jgi:thiol-disulfide isomerase/thioredoxin